MREAGGGKDTGIPGRVALVAGIVVGLTSWFVIVVLTLSANKSAFALVEARGDLGTSGLALALIAAGLYYFKTKSLTRDAYTGFFFGFVIGFGAVAIITDPVF